MAARGDQRQGEGRARGGEQPEKRREGGRKAADGRRRQRMFEEGESLAAEGRAWHTGVCVGAAQISC